MGDEGPRRRPNLDGDGLGSNRDGTRARNRHHNDLARWLAIRVANCFRGSATRETDTLSGGAADPVNQNRAADLLTAFGRRHGRAPTGAIIYQGRDLNHGRRSEARDFPKTAAVTGSVDHIADLVEKEIRDRSDLLRVWNRKPGLASVEGCNYAGCFRADHNAIAVAGINGDGMRLAPNVRRGNCRLPLSVTRFVS